MADLLQIIWAIFLIVVFFGGSIFVHELGHYIAARRRGLKVERFSIGFGPKLFSWNRDGVEWCISLFPLGGYVALPQLAALEGVEGTYEHKVEELPPISYKDTLIVAVMGVVFNIIFAFCLASLLWVVGRPSTDSQQTTVVGTVLEKVTLSPGVEIPGPGYVAGIQPGDEIVAIDGSKVKNWRDVKQLIVTSFGRDMQHDPVAELTLKRGSETLKISTHPILSGPDKLRSLGLLPQEELYVGQIFKDSPAERSHLSRGDQIVSVNDTPLHTYYQYQMLLDKIGEKEFTLTINRQGKLQKVQITPQEVTISKEGKKMPLLGFNIEPKVVIIHQNPVAQIVDAAALTFRTLGTLLHPDSDIKLNHLSGPPGIAWVIYRLSTDFRQVLSFIVLINVNLAILNLLPLPVLDGGHILLATINKCRRKPISGEYVATLQNVFTIALMALMAYVIFFADIPRLSREWKEHKKEQAILKDEVTPNFSVPAK